jgi:peptidoglycan hydrolase-like protein with peptidoglycan-binding domain
MLKKMIFLFTAAILLLSFPITALAASRNEILMKGDKDKYVLELQKALYSKGYLKHKPTGYFGADTQEAVIAFQKSKDLKADGKAGPGTRKALLGKKYKAITEKRNVNNTNVDKVEPGDKGADVKKLQERLKKLGYYKYKTITSYYGPSTTEAVKRFQKVNSVKADGIAGQDTLTLVYQKDAKPNMILYKDKSSDVKKMQTRLKTLGYYKDKINSYFAASTLKAVKAFQKNNGLKADGKPGKRTLDLLYSSKAKKATEKPSVTPVNNDDKDKTKVEKLIAYAKKQLGKKYRRGAEGPTRFDCSGFALYCMKHVGIKLPRTSLSQSRMTQYKKIDKISGLVAGDLMFFSTSKKSGVGHVGIYIGNNQFIHSAPGVGVQIKTLKEGSYYYRKFKWGRRVL